MDNVVKQKNVELSIIVPVYKCSKSIRELTDRLIKALNLLDKSFEIIYVVDGSPENEWELIKKLSKNSVFIKGILLSRNFGQHPSIITGLKYAKGEWIVVMDCDLQDKPEEIKKLYLKAIEGYDIVLGQRINRNDSFMKKFLSKIFYSLLSYLTETRLDPTVANFGIYNKKTIEAVLSMNDYIKFFPVMLNWVGFNVTKIEIEHERRNFGKSSYNLIKLLKLAMNVILTFSDKPLRLIVFFGIIIVITSFMIASYYLYKYFTGQIVVLGYASMIISLWFLFGVNFIILGTVGIYIGKIFNQVKNRPISIIAQTINI